MMPTVGQDRFLAIWVGDEGQGFKGKHETESLNTGVAAPRINSETTS